MSLPDRTKNAPDGSDRTILFGLFADGSGKACFSGQRPEGRSRFSPAGDWYGRWTVRPLHGIPAQRPGNAVCPDDIVVLGRRRA